MSLPCRILLHMCSSLENVRMRGMGRTTPSRPSEPSRLTDLRRSINKWGKFKKVSGGMTFAIIQVGVELKVQVDVRAVTSFFDISYNFAVIVGFVHVLDVGTTDYKNENKKILYHFFWSQTPVPNPPATLFAFGTDEIPYICRYIEDIYLDTSTVLSVMDFDVLLPPCW